MFKFNSDCVLREVLLADDFSSLTNGECERVETRHEELDLWVEYEDGYYILDWEAFSSVDGTRFDCGRISFDSAVKAAEKVAEIVN